LISEKQICPRTQVVDTTARADKQPDRFVGEDPPLPYVTHFSV
jgi:hypothetical protein